MNPLTVTWAPHIYTDWGWRNFKKWIHSGMDNYLMTPNGKVHRLLTRLSTDILFHPFQPFMIGQKLLAPKMADLFKIPLVFFGENEAEYGNPIADTNNALRNKNYYASDEKDIYLGGVHVSELVDKYGISKNELSPYLPIDIGKAESLKIETHYLGYYLKWHPQSCYYYAAEKGGLRPLQKGHLEHIVNIIVLMIKLMISIIILQELNLNWKSFLRRCSEIRSKDIDRNEGVSLVNQYDIEFPERFKKEILNIYQ